MASWALRAHFRGRDALPFDPRHHLDQRCPGNVQFDHVSLQRDPVQTSTYRSVVLPAGSSAADCARLCCGDWSCEAFSFSEPGWNAGTLSGEWYDNNPTRKSAATTRLKLWQVDGNLSALGQDAQHALWKTAFGKLTADGQSGFLHFPPNQTHCAQCVETNLTFAVSKDGNTIFFDITSRNFSRAKKPFAACSDDKPCCSFMDDINALVPGSSSVTTGVRAKLPSYAPPYAQSSVFNNVVVDPQFRIGINGDEFPITWGQDGHQYTGAGDNTQAGQEESPLSFFKVVGGPDEMGCDSPPTHDNHPSPVCTNITQQGSAAVVGPNFSGICPEWREDIPNLKSSGVLSIEGVLYWMVSCFNYGDDDVFNRQRYGPAWIVTSRDAGVSWNLSASPSDMFPGRLAAPRFVQYGQDYDGAPDDWVYVYFPGTTGGSAFFENNDQILLGRVDKLRILDRDAYQFFNGLGLDGSNFWTSDSSIAVPVWTYPLMTSMQQANFHPGVKRYIFANWAWISYDGYPRPDHSPDEKNARTGHQRTQLLLVEAPKPWGPFSIFYRDDDWTLADGSVGAYTPVFPPAWIGEHDFWMVSTQCCGNYRLPLNNYNLNVQRISFKIASDPEPADDAEVAVI